MMCAYNESYLSNAMTNLGDMFDFAVNGYKKSGEEVWQKFAASDFASEFGKGNPKFVVSVSGIELFCALYHVDMSTAVLSDMMTFSSLSKSPEFWCGWILAYYQWSYNTTFVAIQKKLSLKKLLSLYPILHEIDEQRAAEMLYERLTKSAPTRLAILRKERELSQSELAALSGVHLRSIQLYEQRNKDINKAQAETLHALAKTLCCSIENLLER